MERDVETDKEKQPERQRQRQGQRDTALGGKNEEEYLCPYHLAIRPNTLPGASLMRFLWWFFAKFITSPVKMKFFCAAGFSGRALMRLSLRAVCPFTGTCGFCKIAYACMHFCVCARAWYLYRVCVPLRVGVSWLKEYLVSDYNACKEIRNCVENFISFFKEACII